MRARRRGLLTINLLREIKGTRTRFLSIAAISMLGVAFFCGLRATGPDMIQTCDAYFDRQKLTDIQVMTSVGLAPDNIRALEAIPGVEAVIPGISADALMLRESAGDAGAEMNIHFLSLPLKPAQEHPANPFTLPDYDIDPAPKTAANLIEVKQGRLPLDNTEVALDAHLLKKTQFSLGDEMLFKANGAEVKLRVVGLVESARYISSVERGNSTVGRGTSDGFAYASGTAIAKLGARLPLLAALTARYTYADIVVAGAREMGCFSDGYKDLVAGVSDRIEQYGEGQDGTWYVRNRSVNPSYDDYQQNTERIEAIGKVFPLIFYIVAALVTLTTMTRMVEEERIQIGTFKALGYSNAAIAGGYFSYALLATLFGGIVGSIVGFRLFPVIISNAYGSFYRMPAFVSPYRWDIAVYAVLFTVVCTTGAAVGVSLSTLHETAAAIMRPKAPKPGKRVFLERVGFIWRRLQFTSKVTVRNLLRYKKRFWMSIVGIAGSCALMLTGFGLEDSIFQIMDKQFGDVLQMQVQAFSYDTMGTDDWAQLLQKRAQGNIAKVMLCRDRTMEITDSAKGNRNVHLLMVEDPAKMEGLLSLKTPAGAPVPLTDDGAVVTEKLAELYGLKPGSMITLEAGTSRYAVRVSGIAENYVLHYVFVTPAYYRQATGEEPLYNGLFANLSDSSKAAQDSFAQSMLGDGRMYTVNFASDLKNTLHGSLDSINYVVGVLIVCAALLAFVVMFNLTNINITERRRELATIRVLGFYDKELYSYVFRENNALAVIGALLGLLAGIGMHKFVIRTVEVDIVRFVQQIAPLSYVYSFALTIVFALTVNLFMRRHVRGIDMVESLKSAE